MKQGKSNENQSFDWLKEVPGFHAIPVEMFELVKFWIQRDLHEELFWLSTGMAETCEGHNCNWRVGEIEKYLPEDTIQKAKDKAVEEFKRAVGPETWRLMTEGTEEEWEAERDRVHAELEERPSE